MATDDYTMRICRKCHRVEFTMTRMLTHMRRVHSNEFEIQLYPQYYNRLPEQLDDVVW